jgi:uncharacterized damage-inducible protein DinB
MLDWIEPARREFQLYRHLAESASAQVDDVEFFIASASGSNSIAAVTKHVGGNLRSRWTDFLTTDGEKTDRDRDSEFVAESNRDEILSIWHAGWAALLHTLDALKPEDLEKTITIRGQPLTVPQALLRSLAHTAHHAGQIITLARQFRGDEWRNLSIPRAR